MNYQVLILRFAQKKLATLPDRDYKAVCDAIRNLVHNPSALGCKKLKYRPAWFINTEVCRVIYEINHEKLIITVVDVGYRRDVYR